MSGKFEELMFCCKRVSLQWLLIYICKKTMQFVQWPYRLNVLFNGNMQINGILSTE